MADKDKAPAKAEATLRFLKRTRLHGGRGTYNVGDVLEFEGDEDQLDALLRGPDPCAEEMSAADVAAYKREQEKAARREAARKRAEEGEEEEEQPKPKSGKGIGSKSGLTPGSEPSK